MGRGRIDGGGGGGGGAKKRGEDQRRQGGAASGINNTSHIAANRPSLGQGCRTALLNHCY